MTTREAALHELDALEDAGWDTPERRERLLRRAGRRLETREEPAHVPTFEPGPDTGERFGLWYRDSDGSMRDWMLPYPTREHAERICALLFAGRYRQTVVMPYTSGLTFEEAIRYLIEKEREFRMSTDLTTTTGKTLSLTEKAWGVIATGDLNPLTTEERATYYLMRCDAVGLDPNTQPFEFMLLNNKLQLYAKAVAAEQIAANRGISTEIIERRSEEGLYFVTCRATGKNGRTATRTGILTLEGLKGEPRAIAMMKAESKACRRAIKALTGFGAEPDEEDGISVATTMGEHVEAELRPLPAIEAGPSPASADDARLLFEHKAEQFGFTGDKKAAANLAIELLGHKPDRWTKDVWMEAYGKSDTAFRVAVNILAPPEVVESDLSDMADEAQPTALAGMLR